MSTKYRPYLTSKQLHFILSCIETAGRDEEPEALQIQASFHKILALESVGAIKGSYVPTPRQSVADKLGLVDPDETRYLNGEMTPEEEIEYQNKIMRL